MIKVAIPRTLAAATALLEQHAAAEARLAMVENDRRAALALINGPADTLATPLIDEIKAIGAALEPWWAKASPKLTDGKRKSIELGGCVIGTRVGNATLGFTGGDDKAAVTALRALAWAKPFVRVTYAVDKAATRKALTGKRGDDLKALGFRDVAGAETFFVTRIDAGAGATIAQ